MADEENNRAAFEVQARYCDAMAAPRTAALCRALGRVLTRGTLVGTRLLYWAGEPVADATVLRIVGGLHALARRGVADPFAADDAALAAILAIHDAALLPWLDGPPQTNEAQRSAGLMTGLLHVAATLGLRLEILEIGSSAGLNLLIDRMRFDLGGVRVGPADSPLAIVPHWRGPPPPAAPITVVRTRGVDLAPVDVRDPAQAERLAGYVWVDAQDRLDRLATAIAMVRAQPVDLTQGDAADWVEQRLAEPQEDGTVRVLMHSVVWQYLPAAGRARIRAAMAAAGARATPARPLGWVMMEPNRDLHRHEVRVQCWPSAEPMQLVALTHAHGAWVEGLPAPYETRDYVMRRGAYE
ncbi:hypothetical protein J2Y58_000454 [Sphingomonas sp. BE138]|uniref:DUF2332 domain-containing protein n=1 Tax=Sphingomonas sp. BE138 TaxID=2817845 RepID=UPI0028549232|nr:DUF2332 family protein [Sphingomonas sp. BE138]MDR6787116.1 hypothetical protein [Sphingomonas sp. BE138]